MKMTRGTYSITEEEMEDAKVKAAERRKSLSRLIRDYLVGLPHLKK